MTLPWRQINLRECRVGSKVGHANVFKDVVPEGMSGIPTWVEELNAVHPNTEVWQFFFDGSETKNGESVQGILPRRLVQPLEDFNDYHRQVLLGEQHCNRLFISDAGAALTADDMTTIVGTLTLQYTGRWISPHPFRHAFAWNWLDENSADYLTLSKILWHKNVLTTLRMYARKFDESHGAKSVDEWIERRKKNQKKS
jgi:hypothetical protein